MATAIKNAKNVPINEDTGTIPDVSGTLAGWFQPMTFGVVTKTVEGYQNVETVVNITLQGVIQALGTQRLLLKPEGQRAWTWFQLHADRSVELEVDSVVIYLGVHTRVMAKRNQAIYGYIEYELCTDYTGSDPEVET